MQVPSRFPNYALQDLKDRLVGCLYLAITLGVINERLVFCDSEIFAQLLKILVFKLFSIISNNGGRYSIPTYDVIYNE